MQIKSRVNLYQFFRSVELRQWIFFGILLLPFTSCKVSVNKPGSEATTVSSEIEVPPSLTLSVSNAIYPLGSSASPVVQKNTVLFSGTVSSKSAFNVTCTYQSLGLHLSDSNFVATDTPCSSLQSYSTVNSTVVKTSFALSGTSTSSFTGTWIPTKTQRGSFKFTFKVTSVGGNGASSSKSVIVTVRDDYSVSNLVSVMDANVASVLAEVSNSTPLIPYSSSSSASSWLNLASTGPNGTLTFGTANPWQGTGQSSTSSVDPYRLNFGGTADSMNLGNGLNLLSRFGVQAWVKPGSPSSTGRVIAGNGGGTGDGYVLRQSTLPANRAEFVVGKKYYSYRDLVLGDKAAGYWRLNESSAATTYDLTGGGANGTQMNSVTLNATGAITGDADKANTFNGSNQYIEVPYKSQLNTTQYSIEAWAYVTGGAGTYRSVVTSRDNAGGLAQGYVLYASDGNIWEFWGGTGTASLWANAAGPSVVLNTWTHLVGTYDGTNMKLYVNGVLAGTTAAAYAVNTVRPLRIGTGVTEGAAGYFFPGSIDDVSYYPYALTAQQVTNHYQTGKNGNYAVYPGNAILADTPLGYWRLGEKTGLTAYDLSGNNSNGTYYGGYTLDQAGAVSGDSDSSTTFNGTNGYVGIPLISNKIKNVSMEAWFKTTNYTRAGQMIFFNGSDANANGYGVSLNTESENSGYLRVLYGGVAWWATGVFVTNTNWHHVALVINSASAPTLYLDGTAVYSSSGSVPNTPTVETAIGRNNFAALRYFQGSIDEVAFYDYPLSATQVAKHYNSSAWWYCQSQTILNSSNWNLLSAIYDGSGVSANSKLFVNGKQECSITHGISYSPGSTNTVIGGTPLLANFWQGALSILKIFGTSDGTTPVTAASVGSDFEAEANRFRQMPVENIVTSGMTLHLDAANAKQGLTNYVTGCSSADVNWFDLTNLFGGTLVNYSACPWVGAGTPVSPYSLALSGTPNHYVNMGTISTDFNANGITVESWAKFTTTGSWARLIDFGNGQASNNILFARNGTGSVLDFAIYNGATGSEINTPAGAIVDNTWQHFVATYDPVSGQGKIYVNGVLKVSGPLSRPNVIVRSNNYIGKSNWGVDAYFGGNISVTRIYSRPLSLPEIKQNCLAQEARFTNTPQSICGAP